ncbi:MAG: clan AA aspartic protease [Okeania sp. SIO3H1]|uniref:clan AA aspartic protease n=1 Tax=Okeania sp. SIO1I7 TaxID=2607772 RepID=UPI0013C63627|nr:clan AA aspartic protease [Okeania sp. SIO1I7]NEN89207.1 clan AA aspartic protease [Okeania sp. SIO3H1]NET29697.1 clan AA aspartic protease [Okeania sp. SIO1I7]
MISGIVNNGHPTVSITFRLPNYPDFSIQFVVDTGFTGELCLPSEVVASLGLPFKWATRANLADNTEVMLPIYEAIILWNGEEKTVRVLGTGKRPLLGTAMLEEAELVIQFTEGWLVTIEDL